MAKGNVSINSDFVSSVIANFNESYSMFTGDIASSIEGDFAVLKSLGFTNCLSKIKTQSESLGTAQKAIIDSISSHLSEIIDNEKKLEKGFSGGYSGGSFSPQDAGSSSEQEGSGYDIEEEEDGKKINVEGFSKILESLDIESGQNLLTLLDMYKSKDTSLNDLLLDYKNSEELFKLLKKILGDSVEFEELSADDIKEVQKVLINYIVKSDTKNVEFDNKSILMEKEYLRDICNEYKIEPSDLLFDDLYRNVLKTSLKDLYTGNVDSSKASDEDIIKFRDFIDSVALENNISAQDLLDKNIELLL